MDDGSRWVAVLTTIPIPSHRQPQVEIASMSSRTGNRDDLVVATKYTGNYKRNKDKENPIAVNRCAA